MLYVQSCNHCACQFLCVYHAATEPLFTAIFVSQVTWPCTSDFLGPRMGVSHVQMDCLKDDQAGPSWIGKAQGGLHSIALVTPPGKIVQSAIKLFKFKLKTIKVVAISLL